MSQSDFDLANQSRSLFRADNNAALQALAGCSSGATEPTTKYAYQLWADTSSGIMKQRNAANNAWINLYTLASGNLAQLGGATFTSYINEARGTVTMHATTMDLWAQPNTIDGTGSAVTITNIANAPQAGAKRILYPITGTVITNGATFAVDGAADYTTAAGDALEFEAVTTSTYKVHITKKDGTAVVVSADYKRRVSQIQSTQVGTVATGTKAIPFDNSIPQNTEGDQFMSLAITPLDSSSTLEIDISIVLASSAVCYMGVALFVDSTANALAATNATIRSAGDTITITFKHIVSAVSTSSRTYKVRAGGSSGTTTFNGSSGGQIYGGAMASSITIKEYLPL